MKEETTKKISFLNAISILINSLKEKDKKKTQNILLFFLYLLFLIIIIKIPFIYIRDMITNIFNINDDDYTKWFFIMEIIYAFSSIMISIREIKKKAKELKKNV